MSFASATFCKRFHNHCYVNEILFTLHFIIFSEESHSTDANQKSEFFPINFSVGIPVPNSFQIRSIYSQFKRLARSWTTVHIHFALFPQYMYVSITIIQLLVCPKSSCSAMPWNCAPRIRTWGSNCQRSFLRAGFWSVWEIVCVACDRNCGRGGDGLWEGRWWIVGREAMDCGRGGDGFSATTMLPRTLH